MSFFRDIQYWKKSLKFCSVALITAKLNQSQWIIKLVFDGKWVLNFPIEFNTFWRVVKKVFNIIPPVRLLTAFIFFRHFSTGIHRDRITLYEHVFLYFFTFSKTGISQKHRKTLYWCSFVWLDSFFLFIIELSRFLLGPSLFVIRITGIGRCPIECFVKKRDGRISTPWWPQTYDRWQTIFEDNTRLIISFYRTVDCSSFVEQNNRSLVRSCYVSNALSCEY